MLTHSQQRTLDYIQAYILRNGHAPTYPEIAEGIGIQSQGTAHRYVKALLEMGSYLMKKARIAGYVCRIVRWSRVC